MTACRYPVRLLLPGACRTLLALLLLGCTCLAVPPLPAGEIEPLALDEAVSLALAANPGLAGMQARAAAMAALPPQAGALPDPVVSLSAMNFPVDSFERDQEPMTQLQLGIEQALPYPGKRALKQRAAEFDAGAADSDVDESRLLLVRDVQLAWWQMFYLDRALETVSRNQDLLRQFVQIAQTRYQVGEGLQQEVLLAQVELSRLLDRAVELQGLRQQQAAQLNALLDRDTGLPVRLPEQVEEQLPELLPATELQRRAGEQRPLLEQRRRELEAARTRHALARRDGFPDFTLGAAYGLRDGNNADGSERADFATLRLGMTLPLYASRKQDRAVDQRASERLQRQYALQDETRQVQATITATRADYRRAREQVQLYQTGIIPQARQSVASMLSGYQVNKVDFLNLARAQITLYDYETQYWKSFSDARQALARLRAAVGGEVTE